MKTPLKYGMRIHLASSFNCTLVVAPDGIFIVFSAFFFSLQLHPVHVCTDRDTVRARISTERDTVRDPAPSRDRDVAALRADVAWLCCHLPTAFATLAAPPIKDSSALNIGRNGNAPPRFAVGSIRFFLVVFFFDFMPMLILVLAFIAAQTAAAAALSLRAESLAVTRPSALSASTLSAVCLSVRSLLREYAMSCSQHAASSGFMPSSPLAS